MATLQQQLNDVHSKIEVIHQKIECISAQMDELLASVRANNRLTPASDLGDRYTTRSGPEIHRDILRDDEPAAPTTSKGQIISQELQMQLLMAQLTAAYNRIAALEEQLMSQRLH